MNIKNPALRFLFFLCSSLLFFVLFYLYSIYLGKAHSKEEIKTSFEKVLHQKEIKLNEFSDSIKQWSLLKSRNELFNVAGKSTMSNFQKQGFSSTIYKNNKLWFWTNNEVIEFPILENKNQNEIIKSSNGWYIRRFNQKDGFTFINYLLIKQEFSIKNSFLKDRFSKDFSLNPSFQISKENSEGKGIFISSYNKSCGFYLIPTETKVKIVSQLFAFSLLLFALFLFVICLSIIKDYLNKKINPWISFLLFCIAIVGLRYALFRWQELDFIKILDLFNPSFYAYNSVNSSLADLFINVFLLFLISKELLYGNLKLFGKSRFTSIYSILLFGLIHLLALASSQLVSSLVKDSVINFDLSNFYRLSEYSFLGIFVTALIFFTFYSFASYIINQVSEAETSRDFFLVTTSISATILLLLYFLEFPSYKVIYFSTGYIFIHWIFEKEFFEKEYFSRSIIYILLFATWGAQILTFESNEKKTILAKNFSEKIASEKDNIAEFLFPEISNKIIKEDFLSTPFNYNELLNQSKVKKIKEKYLIGYWDKFDAKIYVYDTLCRLLVKSPNTEFERIDFFEKIYTQSSNYSGVPNLYYIPAVGKENKGLLATIKLHYIENGKPLTQSLFIEFSSKFNSEEIGYPSLLVDKEFTYSEDYNPFSYCKYKNGKLISLSKDIDFKYNLTDDFIKEVKIKDGYFTYKNYKHYILRTSKNTFYLVSYQAFSFSQRFNFTSYLFLIYGVCFLVFLIFRGKIKNLILDFQTLNTRIRWVVIVSVFLALTSFGAATILYFNNYFEQESRKKISGKLQNMIIDIGSKFGDEQKLNKQSGDYYNYLLSKLYNVFGTDINLFDRSGVLVASSRIKVFEEGILSNIINPAAFKKLAYENESEFLNKEYIGDLSFVSIYVPLFNNENQLLGYIQLPFFNQQQEIQKEILNLAVTLVNIYVLLFVISGLFSIWLANRITEPLKILKQRFSLLTLGKNNDLISYTKNDEIGNLIAEYNRMVEALAQSVQKLAQSEREGAWREMAKQVAHEIKNPLTPMKLSVQYLQKSLKEDPQNWQAKFDKVAKTIIEQIEALNNIANAFSNFAVLPKTTLVEIEIVDFIESNLQIFKNTPQVEISFKADPRVKASLVYADKEQMLRVMNNLIKNAIQACEGKSNGKISISCKANPENRILIEVKDNGVGIDEANFAKIFVPNFTTKSSGTGLGLAMVKNIIESFNGKVFFETELGKGSSFFIELPIHE